MRPFVKLIFFPISYKMSFLDKPSREVCWNNRDDYWRCLDKNADSEPECVQFRKQYEKTCPVQWVRIF